MFVLKDPVGSERRIREASVVRSGPDLAGGARDRREGEAERQHGRAGALLGYRAVLVFANVTDDSVVTA
ncbi:hypothetical protein [Amycolatopsis japonica]